MTKTRVPAVDGLFTEVEGYLAERDSPSQMLRGAGAGRAIVVSEALKSCRCHESPAAAQSEAAWC